MIINSVEGMRILTKNKSGGFSTSRRERDNYSLYSFGFQSIHHEKFRHVNSPSKLSWTDVFRSLLRIHLKHFLNPPPPPPPSYPSPPQPFSSLLPLKNGKLWTECLWRWGNWMIVYCTVYTVQCTVHSTVYSTSVAIVFFTIMWILIHPSVDISTFCLV